MKKIKIKYKNCLALILVIIIIILAIIMIFKPKKKISFNDSFIGMNYQEVVNTCKQHALNCEFEYKYNNSIENVILTMEKKGLDYYLVVSKGPLTDDILREKKVNELGKVPIMMYHGIVDTNENKYTGGNVDKDGYNRTSSAFREDLEFFYKSGYRMVRLYDYVNGIIETKLGYSPLILTFDDGNQNNFNVIGRDKDGNLKIDPNCAVGILEEYKKKYPDFNVTATFFLMNGLFNQKEYNEEIMKWLVEHNYDIGNHTTIHANFTEIGINKTQEVVGSMYKKLESILKDKYVPIIALPYGSPYKKTHQNYPYIIKGEYNGYKYETIAALRVGWDSEVSPFDKNFDKTFLKRCRAYDNNGKEFDIQMVFKNLETTRYISDGNKDTITIKKGSSGKLSGNLEKEVIEYN